MTIKYVFSNIKSEGVESYMMIRGAGILLPISSLPSSYGIGTLGKEAYGFVDLLVDIKQKYWQVLPIGPTTYGDSPYQTVSVFAGNHYLIDLDLLVEEGLLKSEEIREYNWGSEYSRVDYEAIYESRYRVLYKAFERFNINDDDFREFDENNDWWLDDYSLFVALKQTGNSGSWTSWDQSIKDRNKEVLELQKKKNFSQINFVKFCQYEFWKQWIRLKEYANSRGVSIVGDIPYYVALDSCDVWCNPERFRIDSDGKPDYVSASVPDKFSSKGQIWGMPLYDWASNEEEIIKWWQSRIKWAAEKFDIIKFNHFSGIIKDYAVPYKAVDLKKAKWFKGPGRKFVNAINQVVGDTPIIADTYCGRALIPGVNKLLKKAGWLGTKVLMFAFDDDTSNEYLPHNYDNTEVVVYAGTHDNDTLVGFFRNKTEFELAYLYEYLNITDRKEIPDGIIRAAYQSIGAIAIIQMQDILGLGNEARMNYPSTVGYNWRWRLNSDRLSEKRRTWIRNLAAIYRR